MEITTPEALLDKLEILDENLPHYKDDVDVSDDDLLIVTRDRTNLSFALNRAEIVEVDKKTCNKIKDHIYNGDENEAVVKYPVFSNDAPPADFVGGCKKRYLDLVRRIKASKGYTKDIGVALGIEDAKLKPDPNTVKPTIEVHAAQSGYEFAAVVGKRADSNMWKILGRRSGSEKWEELASGTGKSGNVKVVPTVDGKPEQLQVRVQLYKNNEPYGQPSDAVSVTVSP